MIDQHLTTLRRYIMEHGEAKGTVSWQMASVSLAEIEEELKRRNNDRCPLVKLTELWTVNPDHISNARRIPTGGLAVGFVGYGGPYIFEGDEAMEAEAKIKELTRE